MTSKQFLFDLPVPKGWQVLTVNELKANEPYSCVAGPFGSSISSKYFVDSGVPVIRGGNLTDDLTLFVPHNFVFVSEDKAKSFKAQHVKAGDLVFTCWGTLGQVGLIPHDGPYAEYIISNKQLKLRPNKDICNERFLFYYFAMPQMVQHIRDIAIGAAVPGINLGLLKAIKVVLPALSIQKKITAVLSAYDDLIENNDRRIALLEKMAEEIYREWFVRLRFPGHEQVTFHKGIPEGWERKRFDEFCLLQRGFDLPDDKVKPGIYPVVASTSIKTYHSEFKVQPPVITTGRSGSLGTVLFVNSPAWALNTTLFVKNFFGNSPYLIYYTLKFLKLENFNAGAGVPTLNRNHLGGLHMPVPPKDLQNKFDGKISIIFRQKEILAKATDALKQTRDRLLTRLISGKLSVEDLDIHLPPSMREDA